jgi:UDP-N-acetylglucosamine 2-epimerase (non-hydrolysing)
MQNKKYKVITFVGTRPEIIKLSGVLSKIGNYFNHLLVHTGQHYDYSLSEVFFKDLDLEAPDHYLNASKNSAIECISELMVAADSFLEKEKPDAILIYGDTNSSLVAYVAKRKRIPIFHMEAGNRCYDFRVPEEINRRLVDHLSDVNMVISEQARDNLIREGLRPNLTFKVGSSMPEVLYNLKYKINETRFSYLFKKLGISVPTDEEYPNYLLLSIHREENVVNDKYLATLKDFLVRSKDQFSHVIISAHPRLRFIIESWGSFLSENPHLVLSTPFSFSEYIKLQIGASCVVSDSGSLMEEASLLKFPAVHIRDSHERPESVELGSVVFSSWDLDHIESSIHMAKTLCKNKISFFNEVNVVPDYEFGGQLSDKVINIISSYIEPINQKVYHRSQ